jgi:hypothetical protein
MSVIGFRLTLQRAYALLIRLHDDYGMHSIFAPGFPGLLEAFYVQERLMEYLMPEVYQSFVSYSSQSYWVHCHELAPATPLCKRTDVDLSNEI